jgi:hypothetical protein
MTQSVCTDLIEEQVSQARKRVEEQRAKLQRLIVQGAPTQAAEDLLCKLNRSLRQLTRHVQSTHSRAMVRAMRRTHSHWPATLAAGLMLALSSAQPASAQAPQANTSAAEAMKGSQLLTIVLRHDQSKTLGQINERLKRTAITRNLRPMASMWSPGTS